MEVNTLADLNISMSPNVVAVVSSLTGLDRTDAEQTLIKIATAVMKDGTETEADDGKT